MNERVPEELESPESLACFLMTFLDHARPDRSNLVVGLMTKMIPLCHESYLARQDRTAQQLSSPPG